MAEVLWLEGVGGVAGDMFLAAALDLGLPRRALEDALGTLGVPGWRLEVTRAEAGGIAGTHVDVAVEGPQPHARALPEIAATIRASGLSPRAREAALALFERIGAAEARIHGVPPERVHFHEVGAVDSIVDVCGAAVTLDLLGWPEVVASPPELGQGFVKTAHGLLPVPPPAVLELLRGLPVRPGGVVGEMVTPTGAAILAGLCRIGTPPPMTPRRVGYGLGTKRWPDRPNVLRMTLGEVCPSTPAAPGAAYAQGERQDSPARAESFDSGLAPVRPERSEAESKGEAHAQDRLRAAESKHAEVFELSCNLDDCTGQLVARAIEQALAVGALDAWAVPCTMKKGRPGLVLSALAPAGRREAVARALLAETTTLGVRMRPVERIELAREHVEVETVYGAVRIKVGRLGDDVLSAQPEHDDCLQRARERGVPLKEVLAAALAAWRGTR
ncbi:MAG TPA: nickel pincer cofactor biosynthesis protein LarC [Anaeromyxobacteraceae bacterium]|nr:nickel pincer cofactor biosynthesis protein LarC [Anaeromyxobacteraceae bacterium]